MYYKQTKVNYIFFKKKRPKNLYCIVFESSSQRSDRRKSYEEIVSSRNVSYDRKSTRIYSTGVRLSYIFKFSLTSPQPES